MEWEIFGIREWRFWWRKFVVLQGFELSKYELITCCSSQCSGPGLRRDPARVYASHSALHYRFIDVDSFFQSRVCQQTRDICPLLVTVHGPVLTTTYVQSFITVELCLTGCKQNAIVDWAWRAMRLSTLAGKEVVRQFYGKAQKKSYFLGCSTGKSYCASPLSSL